MTKQEFENWIDGTVTPEDYAIIETVYTFHPSISNVNGKREISKIYGLPGGMRIIRDMLPTAKAFAALEVKEAGIRAQITQLQRELDTIRDTRKELSE